MADASQAVEYLLKNGGLGLALYLITRGMYVTKKHYEDGMAGKDEVIKTLKGVLEAKDREIERICTERDEQIEREMANTTGWKQIAGYTTAMGRVVAESIVPRLPEK